MDSILRILAAFLSTSLFAGLLGLGLAVASRKLRVEKDKTVEDLLTVLPGLNCGACGYAGCEAYAEALAGEKETNVSKCSPGGADAMSGIGEILGLEVDASKVRMVARLACAGCDGVAQRDFQYLGYSDCEAAYVHFQGDKGCKYGCLGLGSCVKSCPVEAISHTENGLVKVDPQKCIGCEICVTVCPTTAMKMVPEDISWFVACNSHDKAKDTKSNCKAGCIGCRICERKFPESGFVVTDNLSSLDYNIKNEEQQAGAAKACPAKCIVEVKNI